LALSQGSIYPVIDRLKKKGLVRATTLAGARKAENLTCTPTGVEAVKRWVCDMTAKLPDDPLRSRVLSLSVLSHAERSQWVNTARAAVLSQLAQVDEFAEANPGAVFELAHDNARSSLLARLRWLDRVETKIGTLIFR
jgi:DNA-binding PadR family transcriptional regulator